MRRPFYLVCGMGNTGSMIARGLLRRGYSVVGLEANESAVQRQALDIDLANVPTLTADVSDREILELAGIGHPRCCGVVATTDDDHANLTIAITSKLLQPDLPVMARSQDQRVSDNMASFGTDAIIDPYSIFAERLYLALASPIKYLVQDWLISVPGSELREEIDPPDGCWIVCGMGRFGTRLVAQLQRAGLPYVVVDVDTRTLGDHERAVEGRGTEAVTLREAGIDEAVAVVAGTGDDIDNLSIVMTALELNEKLFVVARQEQERNAALFETCGADLVARPSMIVGRRILARATTPLLMTFIEHLLREDDDFAERTADRLGDVLGGRAPNMWVVELDDHYQALLAVEPGERTIRLRDITVNQRSEEPEPLACQCLVIERGARRLFLPGPDEAVKPGDRLLFAGRGGARREMLWTLSNPYVLARHPGDAFVPRGAIWRALAQSRSSANKAPDVEGKQE